MIKYITPAVTPLTEDGSVDMQGIQALYDHLYEGGVDGILTLGSIGEFFAIPFNQKKQIITAAVEANAGRLPLWIGTGSPVMEEVLELSDFALKAGADAVMTVPPYYFSLTGTSIERWYDTIADHISGKLYLYNFPDRTGYQIPVETVLNLRRRHPNIVGIKDTISGMDHTRELIKAVKPEFPDFEIYSGFDDNLAHNALSGGNGCISGLSNAVPRLCHDWADALNRGDMAKSAEIQQVINRLMDIYTVGSPFVPYIKCAVQICGVPIHIRSTAPLPIPDDAAVQRIRDILARENLI